jgi:hypothetical protein
MGKVKSELLTEYPCANADCDVLFDARRAELGYCTCVCNAESYWLSR